MIAEPTTPATDQAGPWPRWMTVAVAADYCSLSAPSIRRLLAARRLTPHRVLRGRVLIDRQELDSVIGGAVATIRHGRGTRGARTGRTPSTSGGHSA